MSPSLLGARHSVALIGCVIDKRRATEWRAPSNEPGSERNRNQRVEAAAVADHDALAKAQGARGVGLDLVAVAASGEDIHVALAHDAHDQERRLDLGRALLLAENEGQDEDVEVKLA